MWGVIASSPRSRRVRTPGWFDLRLVAGIVLVVGSLLAGAEVLSTADHTERMWAASHSLAPGVVLQADDLRSVSVRLSTATAQYFPLATSPIGQTVNRQVGTGELVPRSALGATTAATTVTIPLSDDDAPKIAAGQRITVWVSTKLCPAATVLSDVTVQDVLATRSGSFAAGGGEDIVVRVGPDQAQRVIQALALDGGVLRAGLLDGASSSAAVSPPNLSTCAAGGS
jgi:SAF domain